jgi:DNA invertase Pin-like site-specific DNA recombinase
MGGLAEFERKLIRQRSDEGIRRAQAKGRKLGGHTHIKQVIVDDVHLARLATRNVARSRFLDLSAWVSVRLFEGFSGFFRAVVRSSQ